VFKHMGGGVLAKLGPSSDSKSWEIFFFWPKLPKGAPGGAHFGLNENISTLETIKVGPMSVCTLQVHLLDNHFAK
jgi:hypothetical protein